MFILRLPAFPSSCCLLFLSLTACSSADVVLGDGRDAGVHAGAPAPDAGQPPALDAGTLDAGAPDSSDPIGMDASLPDAPAFSEPRPLAGIFTEDASDDDPSLSSDRLLIYFNSKRDGGLGREDIWFATRDDSSDDWQPPQPLTALNTDARETGIALAAD